MSTEKLPPLFAAISTGASWVEGARETILMGTFDRKEDAEKEATDCGDARVEAYAPVSAIRKLINSNRPTSDDVLLAISQLLEGFEK
jgi:hypothetical protein